MERQCEEKHQITCSYSIYFIRGKSNLDHQQSIEKVNVGESEI